MALGGRSLMFTCWNSDLNGRFTKLLSLSILEIIASYCESFIPKHLRRYFASIVSHMYLKSAISISWNLHIFSQKARFISLAFLKASSLLHHRWTVFFHVECPAYLHVPMNFINNFHLKWTRITYLFWWQINNWPNESKKHSETFPTSLPSRVLMAKGMLNCFTPPYVDGANHTNVYIYISVHQKHRHSMKEAYLEACI